MSNEDAKLALQIGYFLLLFYTLRRGFNLADAFTERVEAKLDRLIVALTKKQPPENP